MNTWQLLHEGAPPEIKEFMYLIPHQDLENKTPEEAVEYILYQMQARKQPTIRKQAFELTKSENPLKFELLKDRNNLSAKTDEEKKIDEKRRINAPLITFNSITLPRRSVLLDSRNRNISKQIYSWDVIPFDVRSVGQVNARDSITQIIEVICSPFRIPIVPGYNMLYYKKIRLGIVEFNNQGIEINSISTYVSRDFYHFDFTAVQDGDYLELTPTSSWKPGKLISMCDSLSLNFYGNTEKITFLPDRMNCTYTAGFPTIVTCPQPHFLNTGDLVYGTDILYNEQGYLIAVLSPTTFQINLTTSSPGTSTIYFASRRIQVRLDFICLEN